VDSMAVANKTIKAFMAKLQYGYGWIMAASVRFCHPSLRMVYAKMR